MFILNIKTIFVIKIILMAITTKIKKDALGLYTICGGYISRPFFGTQFEEGDIVNTHHFSGSINAGVTLPDRKETHNFKKGGIFEYWRSTGIPNNHYVKKIHKPDLQKLFRSPYNNFDEYLKLVTEWYSKLDIHLEERFKEFNRAFIRDGKLNKLLQ